MPGHKSFIMTISHPHPSDLEGLRNMEPYCGTLFVALEHESHYHLQCYWTLKKEVGNKSYKYFHSFFPKKKIVSYKEETDLDIKLLNTAWIQSASGKRGYNYDYIIRGLHKDGTAKSFSEVIWNKNNSEVVDQTPALVRAVKRIRNGEHLDSFSTTDEYAETCARNLPYLKYAQELEVRKRYKTPSFKLEDYEIETPRECNHLFTVFYGKPGIGKTQFAKAHFKHPLVVRNIEIAKNHFKDGYHDGLVLDDMNFGHWPREAVIHLTDFEEASELHCRNKNFFKPPGLPIIATTNVAGGNIFGEWFYDGAIQRRIQVYDLGDKSLFNNGKLD